MTASVRLVLAQLNLHVGDISGNLQRLVDAALHARDELKAEAILFPELALCGYPPEDLLLRSSMQGRIERALQELAERVTDIQMLVGYPWWQDNRCYNRAAVLAGGEIIATYDKQKLPNYKVFDEKRYFSEGSEPCVVDIGGLPVALSI